jgi:ATP-dependent helicase HepA
VASPKTPPTLQIGQCYTSEGEPELGIGFVKALDASSVAIEYPSVSQGRLYRRKAPPLRRLEFRAGEKVQSKAGITLLIERVEVRDDLNYYVALDGTELCESDVSPKLTLQRPMERFLAGHWDPLKAFSLRRKTLEYYHRQLRSPARGMIGPRAQLLPHQVYVTHEICRRGLPRALLADEVGLGKTIEAGWIMHRMLQTERIRRVLIIVPESLVNQWFVELFRRFNLSFWVPASQTEEELKEGDIADQERVILSLESLSKLTESGMLKAEDWDLVIVDEAHRVTWSESEPSPEYIALKDLAGQSPGLLLLTATPEQLGIDGHYSRLHLIDSQRFPTLEKFKAEHETYLKVVKHSDRLLSSEALTDSELSEITKLLEGAAAPEVIATLKTPNRRPAVLALIDHYGTGRVYFRNSRSVVELENFAFPKRILERHEVEDTTKWLAEFAQNHLKEKALLICSSAKQVVEWEKKLRDDYALKVVAFHEGLTLLARDRNAAYFEDPNGATLLLCSEIGGEGRNFQHAKHLILADLPEDPDVLEQRIGRLDRIGQASDISIHVPFEKRSWTERFLRFHEEVFHAFISPPKGAREVYELFRSELSALQAKTITKASDQEFEALLDRAKGAYLKQLTKIEAGRDRLIEINSFDPIEGPKLAKNLEASEKTEELKSYFDELLDAMGLHSDDLDSDSLFVDPGHGQYVSYFPGLPPEGLSFTFSRAKALKRTDLTLMTWDHPMVNETLAQLAGQEFGNVSVAAWAKPFLLVDCTFVFTAAATDAKWYADEFFPTTPIRVVFEATGRDLTQDLPWESLKKSLSPANDTAQAFVKKLPSELIRNLLYKALSQAQGSSQPMKQAALTKMTATMNAEIARLKAFQSKNDLISESEILWWEERKKNLVAAFTGAQVRLDSFLLVVPENLGT